MNAMIYFTYHTSIHTVLNACTCHQNNKTFARLITCELMNRKYEFCGALYSRVSVMQHCKPTVLHWKWMGYQCLCIHIFVFLPAISKAFLVLSNADSKGTVVGRPCASSASVCWTKSDWSLCMSRPIISLKAFLHFIGSEFLYSLDLTGPFC